MQIKLERIDPSQIIKSLKAAPHTPPYKIHKYFARRPWNVFEQMISAVSNKGELVLDPFCGGGVTIYEGAKIGRKVIGIDINPLAIFIVRNMFKGSKNTKELLYALNDCKDYLNQLYENFNSFTYQNKSYEISWSELTFEVECNYCGFKNILLNEYKVANGIYKCQNLQCESNHSNSIGFQSKDTKRIGYVYYYLVNKNGKIKTIKRYEKEDFDLLNNHIAYLKAKIEEKNIILPKNKIPILWDRQFEDQLEQKGIKYFEDFFTLKNFLLNTLLRWRIDTYRETITQHNYELLRLIHSNVLKETNIMSFTNDTWQGGNPTTWSKHAFWIPSQFCEVPLTSVFDNSADRIIKSMKYNDINLPPHLSIGSEFHIDSNQDITLINGTLNQANIPAESIDAIVTDPPYGSNVQYLELSHFWYNWNKDLYSDAFSNKDEAIANRKKFKGSKSMQDYETNLYNVFKESYRVLKSERYLTLTFNNKNVTAWLSLLISIFRSGFSFHKKGIIFQDGVENYRQTAHTKFEGSPFGDFIYIFKKDRKILDDKIFHSEDDFIKKVDGIFKFHISQNGTHDKNTLKRSMFMEAMPYIENYAKHNIKDSPIHTLYNYFTKTYFKNLYD